MITNQTKNLNAVRKPRSASNPIIRGYFTDWMVYNTGLPTAFPGYGPSSPDPHDSERKTNSEAVRKTLSYLNSIVYSFLEIKQNENQSIGSYTNNPDYLGNVMFFDPWSDFRKPDNFEWSTSPAQTYPSIGWMNNHRGYFIEKAASGELFDPSNSNFPYDFLNYGNFEAFAEYKKGESDEPEKIIAIGGFGEQYLAGWRAAVKYPDRFAKSIIDIATHFDLDGVDLDWEPLSDIYTYDNGSASDMITLVKAIRGAAQSAGLNNFVISMPITVDCKQISGFNNSVSSCDAWAQLMKYVDHISVMGYDMHGSFDRPQLTGLQSALYPVSGDSTNFSINGAVEALHGFGVPYEAIILGIPTYARVVSGVSDKGLFKNFTAPFRGDIDVPADSGAATGIMSYKFLISNVDSNDIYNVVTNDSQRHGESVINGSYTYYNNDVFGSFETCDSLKAKVKYAQDRNLAGLMAWSIETDSPSEDTSLFRTIWNAYNK